MDGDLRRLKKILKAKWLIYVILKGIGKVSNRFDKFSILMLIGWGRYEWKKRWRQNVPLYYRYYTVELQHKYTKVYVLYRGGPTRWCRVQKITCFSTGSRHQYIVIWWGWHSQQLYIINKTDKTLITCLLIFLFSIGNCHFKDIWHFFDWINFIGIAWFLSGFILAYFGP
jgi:hypothetical protein